MPISSEQLKNDALKGGSIFTYAVGIFANTDKPIIFWFEVMPWSFLIGFKWFWGKPPGYSRPYWSLGLVLGIIQMRITRSMDNPQ